MSDIAKNIAEIKEKIAFSEKKAGRKAGSVKLMAVSKFHPAESVIDAINAGQNLFGENRVQEASAKFEQLRSQGFNPELHIIGSLQRNKVKEAVRIASCIESVDRIELMQEIEKQCARYSEESGAEKKIKILFEIHTGEDSKAGFESNDLLLDAVSRCASGEFPHLVVKGLMTMAPNTTDESLIRASFRTLKKLQGELSSQFPSLNFEELSMGMSNDYPIAIEEGSTIVRVGTAIFGERDYSK